MAIPRRAGKYADIDRMFSGQGYLPHKTPPRNQEWPANIGEMGRRVQHGSNAQRGGQAIGGVLHRWTGEHSQTVWGAGPSTVLALLQIKTFDRPPEGTAALRVARMPRTLAGVLLF